jgi:hypothetical protein
MYTTIDCDQWGELHCLNGGQTFTQSNDGQYQVTRATQQPQYCDMVYY